MEQKPPKLEVKEDYVLIKKKDGRLVKRKIYRIVIATSVFLLVVGCYQIINNKDSTQAIQEAIGWVQK